MLKRIWGHITRGWDEEPYSHPRMKLLPPIIWEILAYAIGASILYELGKVGF
ncbi:MAG: hypothetical protein IPP77_09045 [Bacteroidetes bacterium]|nr:hypothetical protein [Bacteroidota bacterium]